MLDVPELYRGIFRKLNELQHAEHDGMTSFQRLKSEGLQEHEERVADRVASVNEDVQALVDMGYDSANVPDDPDEHLAGLIRSQRLLAEGKTQELVKVMGPTLTGLSEFRTHPFDVSILHYLYTGK